MPIVPQETEKRRTYYRCRLGRSRLDRLFAVAAEGTTGDVVISTQYGSTRYRTETLDSLVTMVEATHSPGAWTNLTFALSDPQSQRNISVTLDTRTIELRCFGSDTTWVYGQDARLREMLESYDGTMIPDAGRFYLVFYRSATVFLSIWITALLAGVVSQTEYLSPGLLALIMSGTGAMSLWSWIKGRLTAHEWSTTGEVASGSPLSRFSLGRQAAVIGSVGVIASIIGVLVQTMAVFLGK